MSNDHKSAVETRKTLPPSSLSAGVQYRCVKATWEKERMRRRCHQMGFDISPQPAPAGVPASSTFYPLVANLVVTNYYWQPIQQYIQFRWQVGWLSLLVNLCQRHKSFYEIRNKRAFTEHSSRVQEQTARHMIWRANEIQLFLIFLCDMSCKCTVIFICASISCFQVVTK